MNIRRTRFNRTAVNTWGCRDLCSDFIFYHQNLFLVSNNTGLGVLNVVTFKFTRELTLCYKYFTFL